jgi:hypothetical protein
MVATYICRDFIEQIDVRAVGAEHNTIPAADHHPLDTKKKQTARIPKLSHPWLFITKQHMY